MPYSNTSFLLSMLCTHTVTIVSFSKKINKQIITTTIITMKFKCNKRNIITMKFKMHKLSYFHNLVKILILQKIHF